MKTTTITTVKDPVCGMDIEAAAAAGKSDFNGQAYFFCGPTCKEKFDLHPEEFTASSGKA
ncbi:MAG: YHS domain-containing protein [Bryobacteraceae bacterium]